MAGGRLFLSGLVLMVVFGLGHLGGFLQAAHAARHDPAMAELTRAMRDQRSRLMGFEPSILDFREYFSLNFSVLLLLAAAIGFAALALTGDRSAAVRALSPIYGAGMVLLLGSSLFFSVAQGVVSCSVIAIVFGLAWWLAG